MLRLFLPIPVLEMQYFKIHTKIRLKDIALKKKKTSNFSFKWKNLKIQNYKLFFINPKNLFFQGELSFYRSSQMQCKVVLVTFFN